MQEQAALIGAGAATRRAIGGKVGFPGLDMILRQTPRAINVLVDSAAGHPAEACDDEARVGWSTAVAFQASVAE